jgi:putative acetyltransferase
MNIKTIEGNFDNPKVNELLVNHFKELRSVSPENSCHVLDIEGLKTENIKFWSFWEEDELVGCGALKFLEKKHGELKSIRIADTFRKKNYGKKVIEHLILEAKKLKITKLSLETGAGNFFNPARKLFRNCGFNDCDPFDDYKENPDSCYMTIDINN